MFGKKLTRPQSELVSKIAKQEGCSESEILRFIFEMGVTFIVSWRKGMHDEAIVATKEIIAQDDKLNRICQLTERYWNESDKEFYWKRKNETED